MRIILRATATTALVAASLLTVASPAKAATVNVGPGQSIQAAINAAPPGTIINVAPGTYRESLLIRKDGIKLRGSGDSESGTVLAPPAQAKSFCGEGSQSFPGICIVAKKFDADFNVVTPVQNVEVSGFLVNFFPGDGIVTYGASHTLLQDNTAARNQGYGQTSFVSTGNVFNRLVSRNNLGPGFYIGDSNNADFILKNSLAVGNDLGILVREANNGTLVNNTFTSNCAGIFLLNHGNDPAYDVRVQNWSIHDNQITSNNKRCDDHDGAGHFGGLGVGMLGTKNVTLENNTISGNQRLAGADQPPAGGVVVVNSSEEGGQNPVGNTIRNNTFGDNRPNDIYYDRTGSGNTFPGNSCNLSNPAWICS